MKSTLFSATLLLFAIFLLGAQGAGVRTRQAGGSSPGPASCPSPTVLSTTTLAVNGVSLTRTTLSCPEDVAINATSAAQTKSLVRRGGLELGLEARNPSECKTPAPECQCGVIPACACVNNTLIKETPNPNDCEILVQSLSVVGTDFAPTFVVQSGQMEEVTFGSCGLFFVNNGLTRKPIEFCWDEFATWGSLGNEGCFDGNVGTELACIASNLEWEIEAIRVDSLDN